MQTATSDDIHALIASRLAATLGPRRYAMWFEQSARFAYQAECQTLELSVPNRFVADWIEKKFHAQVQDAAREALGHAVSVEVQLAPERFSQSESNATSASSAGSATAEAKATKPVQTRGARQGGLDSRTTGRSRAEQFRYRLGEFVTGPSNELAYAAARRLAEAQAEPGHPLFLHGACGLGKTHLLQGICGQVLEQNPKARVLYTTGEQFTNDYISAVRSNKLAEFRRRIRKLDLLAVDDVHFIANKQATQQEFLHSFDQIELSGAHVVLASDSHPKLIQEFSEALVSRCIRGLVVQIQQPDVRTRQRLVEALATRRGMTLQPSVMQSLAERCRGSVRELEGTLSKLHALASLTRRDAGESEQAIGHTLLQRLFNEMQPNRPRQAVRVETLLELVSQHLEIPTQQILGRGRHRQVVLARSLVVHLARQRTSMSYPEIAAAMGRRNHSSVITADQRVQQQVREGQKVPVPGHADPVALSELIADLMREVDG